VLGAALQPALGLCEPVLGPIIGEMVPKGEKHLAFDVYVASHARVLQDLRVLMVHFVDPTDPVKELCGKTPRAREGGHYAPAPSARDFQASFDERNSFFVVRESARVTRRARVTERAGRRNVPPGSQNHELIPRDAVIPVTIDSLRSGERTLAQSFEPHEPADSRDSGERLHQVQWMAGSERQLGAHQNHRNRMTVRTID
jgi:hypothetical protein